jgi:multimeric flavodoxin WrbA
LKKIIGLSCGRKNGNSETLLKAASMGAAELGVETEIIRAMSLKVLPCNACQACGRTNKCVLKDDVDWILEKTCEEDAGLIISVPCYHIRANGYFTCIHERMNHIFQKNMNILKKTRVGGIIGIGGGGYDAWTSFTLPMANIFLQHTRVLVDQFQANYCSLEEWNLWLQDKKMTAKHINELRIQDLSYDELFKRWPQKYQLVEVFEKSIDRAKKLGRNVAKAMSMPIEKVKYVGENYGVECPVCHTNVVVIPKDLPYIACPICYVRGEITAANGKMKVNWNKKDAAYPRFSKEAVDHHLKWLGSHYGENYSKQNQLSEIAKKFESYGKIIMPEKETRN